MHKGLAYPILLDSVYSKDNIYNNTTVSYNRSNMPTKQELEDELNERLKLDMSWSEMPKEDLLEIREGLTDEDFIKKFVAQYANDVAGDTVQDQIENWKPGQVLALLSQAQNDELNPIDIFM